MSSPTTPRSRPLKFKGWAIVRNWPRRSIATICQAPLVYGTKRDALLDKEGDDTVCRVEIREVP